MSFKPSLSIANFTCRFGDKKVLLDLFDEVVKPAFFDRPPREYGKNTFHFFDLVITNVGEGNAVEPVLAGKFVRDTELTRSHILRDDSLIPNQDQMESATSARFVLVLSSHTLLYVPETPHAPPLSMFRSTVQYHLTSAWKTYVKAEARKRRALEKRGGRKLRELLLSIIDETPPPELELIELPSDYSIDQFLRKFRTITRVEFRIHDTNHSAGFQPLIDQLRAQRKATESKELIIVEQSPGNRQALKKQLNDVVGDGNVGAKVVGKGHDGESIKGTNEQFRLVFPLSSMPALMSAFVTSVMSVFNSLKEKKEVQVHKAKGAAAKKLEQISNAYGKNNG